MDKHPNVPKSAVLARYQQASSEPEEHRKMMFSKDTWENRFLEVGEFIPWGGVRRWLDVGCGTARLFESVIASGRASDLTACVGIDAIANNVQTSRDKPWPARPSVTIRQWDIEQLNEL